MTTRTRPGTGRSPRLIVAASIALVLVLAACNPTPTSVGTPGPSGSEPAASQPLATPPASSDAAPSPSPVSRKDGLIAFAQIVPSVDIFDVFTIRPDGTDQVKLVHGKHTLPRWSPDGTRVAMSSYWFGNYESTVNADGTNFVEYPTPDKSLTLECTAWSADATRLACEGFDPKKRGKEGIYTVDANTGQDLKRLTVSPDGAHEIPGAYSPDGTRIVYVRATYTPLHLGQLWMCNADGSNAHKISDTLVDYRVAWSPDGRYIAANAKGDILVFDLQNMGVDPKAIDVPLGSASVPRWSPDGSHLVFLIEHGTSSDIYTIGVDGAGLFRVTTNAVDDGAPDWGAATE